LTKKVPKGNPRKTALMKNVLKKYLAIAPRNAPTPISK
tara:strand:+ start:265 stop:378 length:114 start_codon:yes stop_codon:yes gene_type:complete